MAWKQAQPVFKRKPREPFFFKIKSDIRAQLSREWLNRLAQANSTHVDIRIGHHTHSIQFHSTLTIIWLDLQKATSQCWDNYYNLERSDAEQRACSWQHMIPARIKLYPSLDNATCRLRSCLNADYNCLKRLCHRNTNYDWQRQHSIANSLKANSAYPPPLKETLLCSYKSKLTTRS